MKHIKLSIYAIVLAVFSTSAFATGRIVVGYSPDDHTWLTAEYNNRYSPAPGHEGSYVTVTSNTYGTVSVYAWSAADGRSFYCTYGSGGFRYPAMLAAVNGLSPNGVKLVIERYGSSCADTEFTKNSDEQF